MDYSRTSGISMGNHKLWLVTLDGTRRAQPNSKDMGNISYRAQAATPAEGLRLIRAFSRISDPDIRQRLTSMAETYAETPK